jgi:multiple sugar transport system substrate-binding protein
MRTFGLAILVLLTGCGAAELKLGVFAGNNWGVPGGQSYEFFDRVIQDFEREHPDIRVTYRSGTVRSQYPEWLAQQFLAGTEPDLFLLPEEAFDTYASIGALADLTPYGKTGFAWSRYYPQALQAGSWKGVQYAVPFETNPTFLLVNTSLLGSLGLAPRDDWNWDDLLTAASKMREHGAAVYGVAGMDWQTVATAGGWSPFSTDGKHMTLDSPLVASAIRFESKLKTLQGTQRLPNFSSGHVVFSTGTYATYRAFQFYPYSIRWQGSFAWNAVQLPRDTEGRRLSVLSTLLAAISSRSAHPSEAWQFLEYLTADTKVQLDVLRSSAGWPASRAATSDPGAGKILQENFSSTSGAVTVGAIDTIITQSVPPPRIRGAARVLDAADQAVYPMIDDPFDLENRLIRLNQDLESQWKR